MSKSGRISDAVIFFCNRSELYYEMRLCQTVQTAFMIHTSNCRETTLDKALAETIYYIPLRTKPLDFHSHDHLLLFFVV